MSSVCASAAAIVRRIVRATSLLNSSAPKRPVMFATSMRHPSRSNGSCSHRATTESSPSMSRRRSSGLARLNFGSDRTPIQAS